MFLGYLVGLTPTFLGLYAKFFWQVCQNSSLRVHRIVFMGSIFFEKNTFPFVFHILRRKFSGFRQKYSSTVIRTALVSRLFNRIYANFFSDFTQVLFGWSVRTPLYASTALFPLEATSLIKNKFQIVFHNFGGKFSGFRQNFSSKVIRTALVSSFFNRIYAIFFGIHASFF